MLALIDGDIVAYRCAASAETETEEWIANARCDTLIKEILQATGASDYQIFLTGSGNFRKDIYPEYKANRIGKPKPRWLNSTSEFLCKEFNAEVVNGYEADDALGYTQDEDSPQGTVICSIDKDLLQIPGNHYNWVKQEFTVIPTLAGWRNFYMQMLVGDRADNISGVPGIGPVKAKRILEGCETIRCMHESVRALYPTNDEFDLAGQLLYIWRKKNDKWHPESYLKHEMELLSESTPLTAAENIPSTELG